MNLFRSEEHVGRWLEQQGYEAGATITTGKLGELAQAWWHDRLAPDWRPHTREQNQAILDRLGLTDSFWALP
jgi:NTP pyrophosphatase (non-canonical NTP hydrolase)